MKVVQTNKAGVNGAGVIDKLDLCEIEFTQEKSGEFTAVVPIKLPNSGATGDERVFVGTNTIRVASETARGAKNRSRTLLKCSMPYLAVSPDVANTGIVASQFDPARSGGEISAHLVLTVAKTPLEDFKGVNGSTLQRSAAAQIDAVVEMLMHLVGDAYARGAHALIPRPATAESGDSYDFRREAHRGSVNLTMGALSPLADMGLEHYGIANNDPSAPTRSATKAGLSLSKSIPGYGAASGLDLSGNTGSKPELPATLLSAPLTRALFGQSPITDNTEIRVDGPILLSPDVYEMWTPESTAPEGTAPEGTK